MKLESLRRQLRRRAKAKGRCESCREQSVGVKTIDLEGHMVDLCILCRQRDLELFRKQIGPKKPWEKKGGVCSQCKRHFRALRACGDKALRCALCINELVEEVKQHFQL